MFKWFDVEGGNQSGKCTMKPSDTSSWELALHLEAKKYKQAKQIIERLFLNLRYDCQTGSAMQA